MYLQTSIRGRPSQPDPLKESEVNGRQFREYMKSSIFLHPRIKDCRPHVTIWPSKRPHFKSSLAIKTPQAEFGKNAIFHPSSLKHCNTVAVDMLMLQRQNLSGSFKVSSWMICRRYCRADVCPAFDGRREELFELSPTTFRVA